MPPRSLTTSGRALYRVFVSPPLPLTQQCLCAASTPITRPSAFTHQRRHLSPYRKVQPDKQATTFKDPAHPIDNDIEAFTVHAVRDGKLQRNLSLYDLLKECERHNKTAEGSRNKQHVKQVGLAEDGETPVVKLTTEKQLWEEARARRRAAAPKASDEAGKVLELNWAVDARGDLPHRLSRLVDFLRQGKKVEVVFGHRKGGRRATADECAEVVARTRQAATEEVEGHEYKDMDGQLGASAVLYFKLKEHALARVKEEAPKEDKMAKKTAEKEERRRKEMERQRKADERKRELESMRQVKVAELKKEDKQAVG